MAQSDYNGHVGVCMRGSREPTSSTRVALRTTGVSQWRRGGMFGERGGVLVGVAKGGVTKNGVTKNGQAIFGNGRLASLSALSMALRQCVSPILKSAPRQSTWTAHWVNKLVSLVSGFGRSSFSSLSSLCGPQ